MKKRRNAQTSANNVKTATKAKRTKYEMKELPEGWEMTFDEKTNRFNLSFPLDDDPQEASGGKSLILAGASGKFHVPVDFEDENDDPIEVTMYGLKVYAKINNPEEDE